MLDTFAPFGRATSLGACKSVQPFELSCIPHVLARLLTLAPLMGGDSGREDEGKVLHAFHLV